MAYAAHSPLKAAAELFGELLNRADLDDVNELVEIDAAITSVKRSLQQVEANFAASIRADTRKHLSLVDGGGDDA